MSYGSSGNKPGSPPSRNPPAHPDKLDLQFTALAHAAVDFSTVAASIQAEAKIDPTNDAEFTSFESTMKCSPSGKTVLALFGKKTHLGDITHS